jgi:hypothetical protein
VKYACPRCRNPGIGGLAKRWSSRGAPVECEACGGLFHVLASTSSGIWAAGVLIVLVSLIAAIGLHSFLLFFSGLVLAVACNLWAWKRAKLWPISKESAAHATKANWLLTGLFVFFGLN